MVCFAGAVARQDVVYGVFNHSVNLHVSFSQNTSKRIEWIMGTKLLARLKSTGIYESEPKKYHLFPNGTLEIKRLEKNDAANYAVNIYNKDGTLSPSSRTIPLRVVGECQLYACRSVPMPVGEHL